MLSDRAKKLLSDIDDCLFEERLTDAASLWAVLSALRGPDSRDSVYIDQDDYYQVKPSTTGVIRDKVFPRASSYGITGISREDTDFSVSIREKLGGSGHFLSHARDAFEALGLKWDEWNK